MCFHYVDNSCRKVHEEPNNSVFRAGIGYHAVTEPAHQNGAECD